MFGIQMDIVFFICLILTVVAFPAGYFLGKRYEDAVFDREQEAEDDFGDEL